MLTIIRQILAQWCFYTAVNLFLLCPVVFIVLWTDKDCHYLEDVPFVISLFVVCTDKEKKRKAGYGNIGCILEELQKLMTQNIVYIYNYRFEFLFVTSNTHYTQKYQQQLHTLHPHQT